MAPMNLQQPYDLMAAFNAGMRPYYDMPVRPMQLMPAPPEEEQPNPMGGIGGILKGLGMMGLKKRPSIKGMDSPIPNIMDPFGGGGMGNTA